MNAVVLGSGLEKETLWRYVGVVQGTQKVTKQGS